MYNKIMSAVLVTSMTLAGSVLSLDLLRRENMDLSVKKQQT